MWIEHIIFRDLHVHTYTFTHTAIIEKRVCKFEQVQGNICGAVWGKDRKGRNVILLQRKGFRIIKIKREKVCVEIHQLGTKTSDSFQFQNSWHNFLSLQFLYNNTFNNSTNYKNCVKISDYLIYSSFSYWGNSLTLIEEGAPVTVLITSVITFIK